jgi:hypothetical protein
VSFCELAEDGPEGRADQNTPKCRLSPNEYPVQQN